MRMPSQNPKISGSDENKPKQTKTKQAELQFLYPVTLLLLYYTYKLHQMDDIISLLLLTEEIVHESPNVDPPRPPPPRPPPPPPLHSSPTQACQIPETSTS
jgi:hypothetical protein